MDSETVHQILARTLGYITRYQTVYSAPRRSETRVPRLFKGVENTLYSAYRHMLWQQNQEMRQTTRQADGQGGAEMEYAPNQQRERLIK